MEFKIQLTGILKIMKSNEVKKIYHDNVLYAAIFNLDDISDGLDFITSDEEFIQVGTWNYKKGKVLDAHYHNTFERSANKTQEMVLVLSGKIICNLYTETGEFISTHEIDKNNIIIQFNGVHEYEIIEDSKVIEVKNGPYLGPEKDRTRVNVR